MSGEKVSKKWHIEHVTDTGKLSKAQHSTSKTKETKPRNGIDENERRSTVSYRSHEIAMGVYVSECVYGRYTQEANERNLPEKKSDVNSIMYGFTKPKRYYNRNRKLHSLQAIQK